MAIVLPSFSEDRTTYFVDPVTGSTKTKPSTYCKDVKGCGEKDFTTGTMSMSINECTDCVRSFVGSATVSYLFKGPGNSAEDIDVLVNQIVTELKGAFKTCPV